MNSTVIPGFHSVTGTDHSAWVIVTSSVFLIIAILTVVIKTVSKWKLTSVQVYDVLLIAATAMAFAQTVCIIIACNHGLGRHRESINEDSFILFTKLYYASNILLFISLALTKASNTVFNMAISPQKLFQLSCRGLLVVISLWVILAIFAFAFQCKLPTPWLLGSRRCTDQYGLIVGFGVVNIMTDLAIIAFPTIMVYHTQTRPSKRWTVIVLYLTKISVPIATIFALVGMKSVFESNPLDPTWHLTVPTIWFQSMLGLSIITTSILSLKRVFGYLRTGLCSATIGIAIYDVYSKSGSEARSKSQCLLPKVSILRDENEPFDHLHHKSCTNLLSDSNASAKETEQQSDSIQALMEEVSLQTLDSNIDGDNRTPANRLSNLTIDYEACQQSNT